MPRLSQVDDFPEDCRAAVRAVAAALIAAGRAEGEYFAEVTPADGGLLEVYLRHESHPAGGSWRGDPCGRCRVARYDPKTDTVLTFKGIR